MYLHGYKIEYLYEYEVRPPMQSFTDVVDITDRIKLKRGLSRSTRRIARGISGQTLYWPSTGTGSSVTQGDTTAIQRSSTPSLRGL
jgi:hypothetical protein